MIGPVKVVGTFPKPRASEKQDTLFRVAVKKLKIRYIILLQRRIKWKRKRKMKLKLGEYRGFKELKLSYHNGYRKKLIGFPQYSSLIEVPEQQHCIGTLRISANI